jgi:fructose-specific phosphotransferase system IIA component
MISLSTILEPACVAVGQPATDKDAALAAVVQLLAKGGKLPDPGRLLDEVRTREKLSSTGIGFGVAVPHALSESVGETLLAVLRLQAPIDFEAADGEKVDLLFLMAGSRASTADHLKVLSKLARLLHEDEFRAALRAAPSAADLWECIRTRD